MAIFVNIAISGVSPSVAQWFLPNVANKKVHTAFSGEVPHDEAAAKAVSQYLSKSDQERRLGWRMEVSGLDQIKSNKPAEILVSAIDGQRKPLEGATVRLVVKHLAEGPEENSTGESAGISTGLIPIAPGHYHAQINLKQSGLWLAVLQVERGKDKFETAKEIIVPTP